MAKICPRKSPTPIPCLIRPWTKSLRKVPLTDVQGMCAQLAKRLPGNISNALKTTYTDLFVLVYYVSRNFLPNDFAKYRVLWLKLIFAVFVRRFCGKFSLFNFIVTLPIGAKLSYKQPGSNTKSCSRR